MMMFKFKGNEVNTLAMYSTLQAFLFTVPINVNNTIMPSKTSYFCKFITSLMYNRLVFLFNRISDSDK